MIAIFRDCTRLHTWNFIELTYKSKRIEPDIAYYASEIGRFYCVAYLISRRGIKTPKKYVNKYVPRLNL